MDQALHSKKYEIKLIRFIDLDRKISIPQFQRGLVWRQPAREGFIESLRRGFPFGSILLYPTTSASVSGDVGLDNSPSYSLIDGLQRYSTIQDFQKNPAKYINVENFARKAVSLCGWVEGRDGYEANLEKCQIIVREYVRLHSKNPDDTASTYIDANIRKDVTIASSSDAGQPGNYCLFALQQDIDKYVKNYLDIGAIEIPCIIFTGSPEELADVFTRINQGGTPLNPYQIFAAQWSASPASLGAGKESNKILEQVIYRYVKLQSGDGENAPGLTIDDFDETSLRKSKQISLPDFFLSLGTSILRELELFYPTFSEGKADIIGYGTAAIVFNVDNRKLSKLGEASSDFFENNPDGIEKLVSEVLKVYRDIVNVLKPRLTAPGPSSAIYYTGGTKDLQILSFFAVLWHLSRQIVNTNEIVMKPNYKKNGYDVSLQNIPLFYAYDSIQGNWRSSGDTRLADYYVTKQKHYRVKPDRDAFSNALSAWRSDSQNGPSIRKDPLSCLVLTMWASFHADNYSNASYDVEHVIVKDLLNKPMSSESGIRKYVGLEIPGGTLGNFMFLNESVNRAKGRLDLYDYANSDIISLNEKLLKASHYPSNEDMKQIRTKLGNNDASLAKSTISARAETICKELIESFYGKEKSTD